MTRLAASITVHGLEQALSDAARAAEFGADLLELRIDRFTDDPSAVTAVLERAPLPCIVTCRPTWEGGEYDGDDQTRIALFEHLALAATGPAYLDVELAAYQRSANLRQKVGLVVDHPDQTRQNAPGLILSAHDFDGRPADLYQKIEAMASAPACRVIKIAWRARSLRDNLEAFELIRQRHKPTVALCMGEFGLASRVLARKFGAVLTFASLDPASATAPGQPTLREIKQIYRWDALRSDTAVFGVIGWPVGHSMSPPIHNAGFDAAGYNGVHLPLPIPPEYEHLKATVSAFLDMESLHFRGASVTIPHKQNLLRFVAERDGEIETLARRIGAANTLTVRDDGSLHASNTDYAAALDSVCDALSIERGDLAGMPVAVIGAGGAARAIVAGFTHHGANVSIFNRTPKRAHELAVEFGAATGSLADVADSTASVIINCTPIGMYPNVDAMPARLRRCGPGTVVFDTIYNPLETRLLREARAAGCTTIGGDEMFIRQAAAQFEAWTGRTAPLDVFRRTLHQRLGES